MVDVCVVMRREGKGTGQIDHVPAAADVPVAIEKKITNSLQCQVKFSSRRCEWGWRRVCNRVLPLLQHYRAGGRVTRAAGPHTHLALPTSSAPMPATEMACFSGWQQCHNYTECAGLHCSWYFGKPAVLTTEGSATPTPALILPPGNALLNGCSDARLPVDSPMD